MAVKENAFLEGKVPDDLLQLLMSLAFGWGDVPPNEKNLKVKPLSGAMTNEVYRISWPQNKDDAVRTVLVRVYGEGVEMFFDRKEEIRTFECMSERGHGPRLLGQFSEGRVEEFVHARTLEAADLRNPQISALIAAKLRELHNLDMPGSKDVVLWSRMRNWLAKAITLCTPDWVEEFHLNELESEINELENVLSKDNQPISFCHNDLQYGNIMLDETTQCITFIDYEYSSYNPIAYDLANHFCEMAANYHTETPHILDYSIYPGLEERYRFINSYLSSEGHHPSDAEIEQFAEDVEKYTLANHLFWGLWGLISARVNNIEFNYVDYARQRFEQYWLKKSGILQIPEGDCIAKKSPCRDHTSPAA